MARLTNVLWKQFVTNNSKWCTSGPNSGISQSTFCEFSRVVNTPSITPQQVSKTQLLLDRAFRSERISEYDLESSPQFLVTDKVFYELDDFVGILRNKVGKRSADA